jgi:chromosome segregation ATPase
VLKESAGTEQEERCSSCQIDSEEEDCEEGIVDLEAELISALDELKKERKKIKSLEEQLVKKNSQESFEESQQVIMKLKAQLEEAKVIEETLMSQLDEKQCLEAKMTTQIKEAEKRENILTDHLKERTEDLNQLEAEFGQEERRLEEEIITLKTKLEEAKRTEEVMKIQMMKKEEEVEKLEEEVVTLRVKIVKLNKNVEERETSTSSVKEVEEKSYRLPEGKNEEKPKSYAEVIKGSMKKEECKPLKKNIPEVQKTQEEDYRRDRISKKTLYIQTTKKLQY